jgi:hypothetical protein
VGQEDPEVVSPVAPACKERGCRGEQYPNQADVHTGLMSMAGKDNAQHCHGLLSVLS